MLAAGVQFLSDTDTEVAGHLLARYVDAGMNLADAMRAVARGSRAPSRSWRSTPTSRTWWWARRRNSPLVIGLGEGENFLGSDVVAFIEHTKMALELAQDEVVEITPEAVTITDSRAHPSSANRSP